MYDIHFAEIITKQQKKIPKKNLETIKKLILALAENPRPFKCKKLSGGTNEYRLRHADYRVLYTIDDKNRAVFVYGILHRREAYR